MEEIKNVREEVQKELTENQKVLIDKAKRIEAVLSEEPKATLYRFLRFTEVGVTPDVRLVLIEKEEDGEKPESTDEGASGADSNESTTEGSSAEPAQA